MNTNGFSTQRWDKPVDIHKESDKQLFTNTVWHLSNKTSRFHIAKTGLSSMSSESYKTTGSSLPRPRECDWICAFKKLSGTITVYLIFVLISVSFFLCFKSCDDEAGAMGQGENSNGDGTQPLEGVVVPNQHVGSLWAVVTQLYPRQNQRRLPALQVTSNAYPLIREGTRKCDIISDG